MTEKNKAWEEMRKELLESDPVLKRQYEEEKKSLEGRDPLDEEEESVDE